MILSFELASSSAFSSLAFPGLSAELASWLWAVRFLTFPSDWVRRSAHCLLCLSEFQTGFTPASGSWVFISKIKHLRILFFITTFHVLHRLRLLTFLTLSKNNFIASSRNLGYSQCWSLTRPASLLKNHLDSREPSSLSPTFGRKDGFSPSGRAGGKIVLLISATAILQAETEWLWAGSSDQLYY